MKKLLLLSVFALIACGGNTNECQYTTLVKTTYNLNKEAVTLVTSRDTLQGCYNTTKKVERQRLRTLKKNLVLF